MKKLALSLNELRIETFATVSAPVEPMVMEADVLGPTFNQTCRYTDAYFGTCCGIGC